MRKFKEKNSNVWKWVLFIAVCLLIAGVGYSILHLTPGLAFMVVVMCGSGLAISFVYSLYTNDSSPTMRRIAWISESVIIVGLIGNLIIHASLSRRFDVAQQAREARHVEEEREQQAAEAEAKRKKALAESEAALLAERSKMMETQRRLTEAQNRQLWMVDKTVRRLPGGQVAPIETSAAPTPDASIAPVFTSKKAVPIEMLTPEQVQELAWWWVLTGIIVELGCFGGTLIFFIRGLIRDENGNMVADWKEELDPDELAERFPEDYRRLYGSRPRQAPNMSPTPTPAYARKRSK